MSFHFDPNIHQSKKRGTKVKAAPYVLMGSERDIHLENCLIGPYKLGYQALL
jgi:hypothetical protein